MSAPDRIEALARAATGAGWQVERRDPARPLDLPEEITRRYPVLSRGQQELLRRIARATSADEAVWFVCEDDFRRDDPEGFAWNEIERMELESAASASERRAIVRFWDRHVPVMMAPDGDYDYLAIALDSGAVVHGCAPDWEDVVVVAGALDDWLAMLSRALRDPRPRRGDPLALRLMARRG